MPERFNFYDLYGYLIPGMVFLAMLWLPWGLSASQWPDLELSSAFVFLIGAYIVGVLLNRITAGFVPVKVYDPVSSKELAPSVILIGDQRERARSLIGVQMSEALRSGFVEAFRQTFFGVSADEPSAYFLARGMIQAKVASYSEQFQGLYTMCQILACVFVLAGFYFLGWSLPHHGLVAYSLLTVGLALFVSVHAVPFLRSDGRLPFLPLCAILAAAGSLLSTMTTVPPNPLLFSSLACGTTILMFPFLAAFEYFRGLHALNVLQSFYVWHRGG